MLELKNNELVGVVEFLEKLELTPKASRVRTKLNKLLGFKVEELYKDEMDLLDRFGKKDDKGNLLETDGAYSLVEETALSYHKEKEVLLNEVNYIDIRELHAKLPILIDELENSDEKLTGHKAEVFDFLMDLLEMELKNNA
jgi:Protein of unknown function (DUF1617).